jgi:hypothetical protein
MAGIRLGAEGKGAKPADLLNTSLCYAINERFTAGIELNNGFNSHKRRGYLTTPQFHIDLNRNFSL